MTDARNAALSSAQDRGWGPPCPTTSIVRIDVGGRGFSVHRKVAAIFQAFIGELVSRGYPIDRGTLDDWSYVCRHISNDPSKPWSNHAWGLAVDINSLTNPMRAPMITDMPAWVRDAAYLLEKYGLRWGGTYHTTPDPMHFEFMLSPSDADRLTAALDAKEWWQMSTMPPEVQAQVQQQAEEALASDTGRQAIRRAVWEALASPPPAEVVAKGGSVAYRVSYLNPKLDALAVAVGALSPAAFAQTIRDAVGQALASSPVEVDENDVRAIADQVATITGERLIRPATPSPTEGS